MNHKAHECHYLWLHNTVLLEENLKPVPKRPAIYTHPFQGENYKFTVSIVNFIVYNAQSTFAKYTDYTPVSGKFTLVNVKAKDRFHYLDPL